MPASITFGDINSHCDHLDVVYTDQKSAKYDGAHTWGFQLDSIQIGHEHFVAEIDVSDSKASSSTKKSSFWGESGDLPHRGGGDS